MDPQTVDTSASFGCFSEDPSSFFNFCELPQAGRIGAIFESIGFHTVFYGNIRILTAVADLACVHVFNEHAGPFKLWQTGLFYIL